MKLAPVRVFSCKHAGPLPSDARIQSGTATIRGLGLTLEKTPTGTPTFTHLACVASVSNRVIARKLERKQKKVEGGGGGEKRKRLPANPTILEKAP